MKKTIKLLTGTILATTLMTTYAFADSDFYTIKATFNASDVLVNGQRIDTESFSYNGTTYLPLRAISESMGMTVQYDAFDDDNDEVNLKTGGTKNIKTKASKGKTVTKSIRVEFDEVDVSVNGNDIETDDIVYNGTTYLPLKQIANATGAVTTYDSATKTVNLKY